MSDDVAKRLNRILWRERLKKFAIAIVAVSVFALYMGYRITHEDRPTGHGNFSGVVSHTRPTGRRNSYAVEVHLDDGRDIKTYSSTGIAPAEGARVEVSDVSFTSGRHSYRLLKVVH